jgi:hypothetical protein
MLGVAGARSFLRKEGYVWIAPVSAFYKNAVQNVDLSMWHPHFPSSVVKVNKPSPSLSKLYPDYLALRPVPSSADPNAYDWAVVEAKGTDGRIDGAQLKCRPRWLAQARNIVVSLDGNALTVPRHLVVATRVNPNARRERTRRIQIRAWNQQTERRAIPEGFALEVAAAHLFGLFMGLQLPENAHAIGMSVQARREHRTQDEPRISRAVLREASSRAARELRDRAQAANGNSEEVALSLQTQLGPVDVRVADPLLQFARHLRESESIEEAVAGMRTAEAGLRQWRTVHTESEPNAEVVTLPAGLRLNFPETFSARRREK